MRPEVRRGFSRFLEGHEGRLHFAAHSHHFWPDVSFDAQAQAWTDAALSSDAKWPRVFALLDENRAHLARILSLPDPSTLSFAPSTHDFVARLLSCLPAGRPARILTTDAEFYSFRRQADRLAQDGLVEVTRIPAAPHAGFSARFAAAAAQGGFDMVFFSHVFFDTGFAVPDLPAIVAAVKDAGALVVIDGYHGFMARPTDLSAVASRAFYMAGGYKYAMAGEGACFMHCPPGYAPAPRNTGWFADIANLAAPPGSAVTYAADGSRFMGATFDPTGAYRMNAVFNWLREMNVTVADIHAHARALQEFFLARLPAAAGFFAADLYVPAGSADRGNFLSFHVPEAGKIVQALHDDGVTVDSRGAALRFGFGLYQDEDDVSALVRRLEVLHA